MERHIAKRLGLPCAVISAPVHVQDYPARYSPVMGFEGANVLFDTLIHPLTMGLEEHLLTMFRDDFEFHDEAGPSHLGHGGLTHSKMETGGQAQGDVPPSSPTPHASEVVANTDHQPIVLSWAKDAEKELKKIPFFVRGKARRNTEAFASEQGLHLITLETLYDAKAHFGK